MRVVYSLMMILLVLLLVGFLITNPDQRVSITVVNTEYLDVSLVMALFVSLALGAALTAVVGIIEGATIRLSNRRLRREIQRLEAENSVLRSQSASVELSSEESPSSGGGPGRPRPRDGGSSYRPSAPVYDHNAIDPATRGD